MLLHWFKNPKIQVAVFLGSSRHHKTTLFSLFCKYGYPRQTSMEPQLPIIERGNVLTPAVDRADIPPGSTVFLIPRSPGWSALVAGMFHGCRSAGAVECSTLCLVGGTAAGPLARSAHHAATQRYAAGSAMWQSYRP